MIKGKRYPQTLPGSHVPGAPARKVEVVTPSPRMLTKPWGEGQPISRVVRKSMRLLVRMPTRSRPKQALSVLAKYREMSGEPITIEVVIDDNDASMHAVDVQQQLAALGCVVTSGSHRSKIEAVNGGKVKDWDVLLLASDDMVPVRHGYAARVLDEMARYFPYLDGALYFDDNYVGRKLCTLPIMGRRLYNDFGYVYFPGYRSFFCDNEQTEVLSALRRLAYVDEKIIEHRHPANANARVASDALYDKNSVAWENDRLLYESRKRSQRPYAQAAFDAPPVWLSIVIATVPARQPMLVRLLDFLYAQTARFPREVEIVLDSREGITIGAKRNALINQAVGRFVAHVDDDDWVAGDYVVRQLGAIKAHPDADCVSLTGMMTTDGARPTPFRHSIRYSRWGCAPDGSFERTPEHRNAVRRDLAVAVGFPDISYGEDKNFSDRLRPLLKKEASTGDAPLYFYKYVTKKPSGWYYGSGM